MNLCIATRAAKTPLLIGRIKEKPIDIVCSRSTSSEETLLYSKGPRYKVKELLIKPYCGISLQKHAFRSEHWTVVNGVATVFIDRDTIVVRDNETVFIPVGLVHRLVNNTNHPIKLIEIQVGTYLDEDDIIRLGK